MPTLDAFRNPAIPALGDVVFIKGNKEIGRGHAVSRFGDQQVNVRIDSGALFDQVKDLELVRLRGPKYAYFRFAPISGTYWGSDHETGEGGSDILDSVRIVNEFQLRWGMVPDTFKDVEGYKAALIACEFAAESEELDEQAPASTTAN